jgi:putative hydrolase of the HAD superfamily
VSISIPGRVVVFDYGEVISFGPTDFDRAEVLRLLGTTAADFVPVYDRYRSPLDQGRLSVREYWTQVAADLGAPLDAATLQQLWAADFRSWVSVNPDVVAILAELAAGGTRLALLSNAGFDFGGIFRTAPTAAYFERVFVSAELDLLKPDPAIYVHAALELGITPAEMVFIDNKAENVEGAATLGVTGHVFIGAAELRTFLENTARETPAG